MLRERIGRFRTSSDWPDAILSAQPEAVAFRFLRRGRRVLAVFRFNVSTLATPTGTPAFPNAGQTFAIIIPGMITAPLTRTSAVVLLTLV